MNPCTIGFRLPALLGLIILTLLAGSCRGPGNETSGIAVLEAHDGWARLLPGELPAAGYLTLFNPSDEECVVTGANSSRYKLVQIHESYTRPDGVSGMRPIKALHVPAHGRIQLKPGSFHMMLMQPTGPVKLGDIVEVDLTLADGSHIPVTLAVKPADEIRSAPRRYSVLASIFSFLTPWQPSPTVIATMLIAACLYLRGQSSLRDSWWRQFCFWTGILLMYGALHTRFDYYAERQFFIHRLQHLLLHHLAPFLIALSWPGDALMRGFPARLKERWIAPALQSGFACGMMNMLMNPIISGILFVGLIWLWLIPSVHFYAMLDVRLYRLMNWSMAVDGLLFWWLVLDPRPSPPARLQQGWRVLLLVAIMPPQIGSAVLITFSSHNIYPLYELCGRAFAGISPLDDQSLGGTILWVPSIMMSVVGAIVVLASWFRDENKQNSSI